MKNVPMTIALQEYNYRFFLLMTEEPGITDIYKWITFSPLWCSRPWSVVFHCLASHAPTASGMTCQAMKNQLEHAGQ